MLNSLHWLIFVFEYWISDSLTNLNQHLSCLSDTDVDTDADTDVEVHKPASDSTGVGFKHHALIFAFEYWISDSLANLNQNLSCLSDTDVDTDVKLY